METMTPADIKKIRNEHKLTVAQIADQLGVSPRTVEGWEQGRPIPPTTCRLIGVLYPQKCVVVKEQK